jgi:hypothetical protein
MANETQSGSEDQSKPQSGSGTFTNDPKRANERSQKSGQSSRERSAAQSNQSGSGQSQQGGDENIDVDESDSNQP